MYNLIKDYAGDDKMNHKFQPKKKPIAAGNSKKKTQAIGKPRSPSSANVVMSSQDTSTKPKFPPKPRGAKKKEEG